MNHEPTYRWGGMFLLPIIMSVGVRNLVYQLECDAFKTWIKSHVGIIPRTIPSMHNSTTWLYNLALDIDENSITYLKTSLTNRAFDDKVMTFQCVCACLLVILFCKNRRNENGLPKFQHVLVFKAWLGSHDPQQGTNGSKTLNITKVLHKSVLKVSMPPH